MKPINIVLIGLIGLCSVPVVAQKKVPHSFRYQADTSDRNTSGHNTLRFLTQVRQPNTTFLRLYFAGTQLGEGSYLVLEGTDGARQELRKQDLENWRYSSAYFNGQSVNVSLFAAPGDRNTVQISEIRVTDPEAGQARNARQAAKTGGTTLQTATTTSPDLTQYPYAKAVGRFTDGNVARGTGWIAPNGAIVTNSEAFHNYYGEPSLDIIEFNVPPSVGTTVMHPSPQDQYPLDFIVGGGPNQLILPFKNNETGSLYSTGWVLFDPQPNGTGLQPGERQQEYFRIATNPRNSTIKEQGEGNMMVDIFHYGDMLEDHLQGTFRTLRVSQTHVLPQNDNIQVQWNEDRDRIVLYQLPSWGTSDAGGPITFAGTNVAIGIHSAGNELNLGHGRGFRDDALRNALNDYYDPNSVYVDFDGPPNTPTGEIHKPYVFASQAASSAPAGAQVYFAGGTYPGAVTFNRPMTLRAPVGTVKIGASPVGARKAAGSTIPSHWLEEGSSRLFERESAEDIRVRAYPNPFREQVEINFPFAEGEAVSVRIFNLAGVPIATLNPNKAASGQNGVQWNGTDQNGTPVPVGLYVVQVNDGKQTFTTKVMKK